MQTTARLLNIQNSTQITSSVSLGGECIRGTTLLNQLQLPHLSAKQQATILAELLAATIHLHSHCDEDFQNMLAEAMEALPDDDEID